MYSTRVYHISNIYVRVDVFAANAHHSILLQKTCTSRVLFVMWVQEVPYRAR